MVVRRNAELAQYRGLESSARVQAAAYVAHVGMTLTAQLSAEEAILIGQSPLADPRLKPIVDQFALLACSEVARMGF
jgi:hypothetical protein